MVLSSGWTWFYFVWICIVVCYAIDRYMRIKHSFQTLNADTVSKQDELSATIKAFETRLSYEHVEWGEPSQMHS